MKKLLVSLMMVVICLPLSAHHSTAVNFTREIIEIQGEIEQIRFQNPHTSFVIKTAEANETGLYWLVESDARSTYERKGLDLGAVDAGAAVTITGRKGLRPNTMYLREIRFEDGRVFTSSGLEE